MNETQIKLLEEVVYRLEYHLGKYEDYDYSHRHGRTKKDRQNAFEHMCTHADFIKHELSSNIVFPIINDGNPYIFEDFWKYVRSDVPNYISLIKEFIEKNRV